MQVRFSVSLCKQLWVWNNRQCDATDRQYDVTDSEAHVMSMSCDACHVMHVMRCLPSPGTSHRSRRCLLRAIPPSQIP